MSSSSDNFQYNIIISVFCCFNLLITEYSNIFVRSLDSLLYIIPTFFAMENGSGEFKTFEMLNPRIYLIMIKVGLRESRFWVLFQFYTLRFTRTFVGCKNIYDFNLCTKNHINFN